MSDEPKIIICYARYDEQVIETEHCPTCKSDQQFFAQHQEWYGWTSTCLNCGDQWMDGELCGRPFAPGWRKKQIAYYRGEAIKLGLLEVDK